jgi:hypothetical protein
MAPSVNQVTTSISIILPSNHSASFSASTSVTKHCPPIDWKLWGNQMVQTSFRPRPTNKEF